MSFWKKVFGIPVSPPDDPAAEAPPRSRAGTNGRPGPWVAALETALPEPPEERTIHEAARFGDLETIKVLAERDAALISSRDRKGTTPLHMAALHGQKEVVEFLLVRGVDVNIRNRQRKTPLHDAARRGHREVTLLLLSWQAEVNAVGEDHRTPLHEAASWGDRGVLEALLAHRAGINVRDHNGMRPMHIASVNGHTDVVQLLREYGGRP